MSTSLAYASPVMSMVKGVYMPDLCNRYQTARISH